MKENSPIWLRFAATVRDSAKRLAQREQDCERDSRIADQDDRHHAQDRQRLLNQDHGIEQHADRDEEQHREGIAQGQGFLRRLMG